MHAYVCVHGTYACICGHVYLYACAGSCEHVWVFMCIVGSCVHEQVAVCMCRYSCVCIYLCTCVCICVHVGVSVCMCGVWFQWAHGCLHVYIFFPCSLKATQNTHQPSWPLTASPPPLVPSTVANPWSGEPQSPPGVESLSVAVLPSQFPSWPVFCFRSGRLGLQPRPAFHPVPPLSPDEIVTPSCSPGRPGFLPSLLVINCLFHTA